ncbi:MAG: hypothetical protein ACRDNS_28725 [Trebonia sp.]
MNPARVGREPRGAALHGPRISITCACGHHESVRYGENWTCPGCGKTWDTSRIPREEYAAIRRTQLRFRMLPVALGLLVVGLAAFFTLTGSPVSVVLLLPVVLIGWFVFLRGPHRRRYRRAIATRQRKWTLRGNL